MIVEGRVYLNEHKSVIFSFIIHGLENKHYRRTVIEPFIFKSSLESLLKDARTIIKA